MNAFNKFVNSMSKISSYELFLHQPLNKAIVYLLLLTVVFAGITSVRDAVMLNSGVDELIYQFANEVPDFEVNNGELFVDAEMPLVIEDTPDNVFIIDTSGQLDESVLEGHDQGVFISRYGYTHRQGIRTQHFNFSDLPGLTFTKDDVIHFLPYLKWLSLFIIVFSLLFFFVGKLFSAFIVGIIGLFLESMAKYKIGFNNLYKLSIYALTSSIVLQFLIRLTTIEVPNFWIIYYGLACVYIWKVLEHLRKKDESQGKVIDEIE